MSAGRSTKVPRASVGVTLLDDPDYLVLISRGKEGQAAFGAFVALLLAAKVRRNDGTFKEPIEVVAKMCRWPPRDLTAALDAIEAACKVNGNKPWVIRRRGRLVIRNFSRWHNSAWGGPRLGAGRQPGSSGDQNDNQVDSKLDSTCGPSVSVPESVPGTARTNTKRKSKARTVPVGNNGAVASRITGTTRACDANRQATIRLIRACDLVTKSPVSARRRREVLAALSVVADKRDPLAFITELLERSKKRHVDPLKRGAYIAQAIISEAGDVVPANSSTRD